MSILVTGGAGMVGIAVLRGLTAQGYRAVGYDINPRPELIQDLGLDAKIYKGDVCDFARLSSVIKNEGIDHIVHTACVLTYEAEARPVESCRTNVGGMINVLELSRLFNIKRIVHISSASVYDYEVPCEIYKEDHPLGPKNVYGATKLCSEFLALHHMRLHGLDIVIFRPTLLWGPWQRSESAGGRIVKPIIEKPFYRKPVETSFGAAYDMLYVKDAAQVICKACFAKGLNSNIFNLGAGKRVELSEVARAVRRFFPNADIKVVSDTSDKLYGGGSRNAVDLSKAMRELNFEQRYDIESGIEDYIKCLEHKQT
jgi:nucleoside-diphosphate-sugar epimerase